LHASRNTTAPSFSKCSSRTMLSCEPRSSLASSRLRSSIGFRRRSVPSSSKQVERAMNRAGERAAAAN
jgi:hypothetical protein